MDYYQSVWPLLQNQRTHALWAIYWSILYIPTNEYYCNPIVIGWRSPIPEMGLEEWLTWAWWYNQYLINLASKTSQINEIETIATVTKLEDSKPGDKWRRVLVQDRKLKAGRCSPSRRYISSLYNEIANRHYHETCSTCGALGTTILKNPYEKYFNPHVLCLWDFPLFKCCLMSRDSLDNQCKRKITCIDRREY